MYSVLHREWKETPSFQENQSAPAISSRDQLGKISNLLLVDNIWRAALALRTLYLPFLQFNLRSIYNLIVTLAVPANRSISTENCELAVKSCTYEAHPNVKASVLQTIFESVAFFPSPPTGLHAQLSSQATAFSNCRQTANLLTIGWIGTRAGECSEVSCVIRRSTGAAVTVNPRTTMDAAKVMSFIVSRCMC